MSDKEKLEQAIADFFAVCKVSASALPAMRNMLDCARNVGANSARMDPSAVGLAFKPPRAKDVPTGPISIDDVFGDKK